MLRGFKKVSVVAVVARPLHSYTDKWNCMQVKLEDKDLNNKTFQKNLPKTLHKLVENANKQGNIAIWLTSTNKKEGEGEKQLDNCHSGTTNLQVSQTLIPEAFKLGFKFHVAYDHDYVLYKWLTKSEPSSLPPPLTHQLGVSTLVFNKEEDKLLMIIDKGTAKFYARGSS